MPMEYMRCIHMVNRSLLTIFSIRIDSESQIISIPTKNHLSKLYLCMDDVGCVVLWNTGTILIANESPIHIVHSPIQIIDTIECKKKTWISSPWNTRTNRTLGECKQCVSDSIQTYSTKYEEYTIKKNEKRIEQNCRI